MPIQRYKCLNRRCGKTWADMPPWLSPRRWYGRDVIRKALDLCLDCTTSWRELAALLHGEITHSGRALRLGHRFPDQRTADVFVHIADFRGEEAEATGRPLEWEDAIAQFRARYAAPAGA